MPKMPTNNNQVNFQDNSRRMFMQQLGLLYCAAQMPLSFFGCGSDKNKFVGSGKPPYKVWEEMLMALQTCPDFLEGRMKSLVASKDAEAMFNFVRDEIYLMPTNPKAIGYNGTQFKWGIKGVLRYGMATPREKAELLHDMFSEAGISSKVVFERTSITPEESISFFLRPIQRKFDIEVSENQWDQWKKELQIENTEDYKPTIIDPNLTSSNELAEQLWNFIPNKEALNKSNFDLRWDNSRTPTVEFQIDGVVKYAHLFDPTVPFGSLKNNGSITEASPIKLNEELVEIKLTYREAIHPENEIELISGSWKSRDLIGNQIQFNCLNGLDLKQSAITPIGNLRIFTPSLAFQDFDAPIETLQEHSVIADPFTLEGYKIELPDTTNTKAPVILNSSNTDLVKMVSKVELKATPIFKSLVKLQVKPTDSDGKMVEGLQATDFGFTDNNQPVQVLMESNRRTPKILILFDASGSMPKAYYGENMDAFVKSLEDGIRSNFPSAIVDKWSTPSELFTWLLKASKTNYDLIVYATDGDNDDDFKEEHFVAYQNGPPAIILLNVFNSDASHTKRTFDKMAEVTNGSVIHAKDQKATINKIVSIVNSFDIPPYTFSFYATKGEEHELVLKLDNERLSASDKFVVPLILNSNEMNQGIIGLYLNLKVGNTQYKRVLAGWDPISQRNQKPTNTDFLEVKSLILGGTTFYFEGEGPTLSTSIVDLLKYRLSTRAWGEALLEDDLETAKTEFEKGGFQYHPNIIPLMSPLSEGISNTTYTFASGLRIGVIKQQINIETKEVSESFDFLPTSNYVTFTNGDENAFKINLNKTAQLAIRESSLFKNNTLKELKNASLIERDEAIGNNWFRDLSTDDAMYGYWYERIYRGDGNFKIFDSTATSKAFWQINAQGELYGILSDGTGGGSSNEVIEGLTKMMDVITTYTALIQQLGYVSPLGGLSLSIVATYGVTLTKLYAIVSEVIMIMDTTGMDDKIKKALKELACNVAKSITYATTRNAGSIMGGIDQFIALVVGNKSPFACG